MEHHIDPRADAIMAILLGSSIYSHYDSWTNQPINIVKSLREKVNHLLCHWKETNCRDSIRELVIVFIEKLKPEPTFNLMRQKTRERFL